MTEPLVVAVVLNMNRCGDTLECLESLAASTYKNLTTIVLDCGSTDGSVERIPAAFPAVEFVELAENKGYAGNNNLGIDMAIDRGADWVLVLNDDTVLAPDCVEQLLGAGLSDPQAGVVGPMVYHHNEPQIIQSAGGAFGRYWESLHLAMNESDRRQFHEPRDVRWISGCGMLVRRGMIEQVGTLDERYFIYWEETEWCLRAARHGWRVIHVPRAKLWHKGVQRDYRPSPAVTYYSTRNRLLTMAKHHAPASVWAGACLQIARTVASWMIRPKWRFMRPHRVAMCRAVVDFAIGRLGGPVRL